MMVTLSKIEADQVRRGFCPHCRCAAMQSARDNRTSWARLCLVCYREYTVGPVTVEVLHDICPTERLHEVYGLRHAISTPRNPSWP